MNTLKQAKPDHPVHELIANRWSPYGFADRPVSPEDLRSLFEAARSAPSSYNEQPWRYLVATKANPEQFARLLSCLVEANQAWAQRPGAGLGLHEPAVHAEQPAQRGGNPRLGSCRGRHLRGGHRSRALCTPDDRHPSGPGPPVVRHSRGGSAAHWIGDWLRGRAAAAPGAFARARSGASQSETVGRVRFRRRVGDRFGPPAVGRSGFWILDFGFCF